MGWAKHREQQAGGGSTAESRQPLGFLWTLTLPPTPSPLTCPGGQRGRSQKRTEADKGEAGLQVHLLTARWPGWQTDLREAAGACWGL